MRPLLLTLIILSVYLAWAPATLAATIIRAPNNLDLVGYWPMNEGRGTKVGDMSGNGNHGTIAGNPQWTSGTRGGAMDFDGDGDYVDLGNGSILNPTTALTLSAWVKWNDLDNVAQWIISRDDASLGRSYSLGFHSTSGDNLELQINGFATIRGQGVTLMPDVWYHIVATGNASIGWKIYLNGIQDGTASWRAPNITTGNTNIGRRTYSTNQEPIDGLIDDVRIYSRALTATEITALYNSGAARLSATPKGPTEGLVGHWTFDGPTVSTTTVNDISGNGNHGTIAGNAKPALGKIGQGFNFDGSGDYVSASLTAGNTNNVTLTAWVKPRVLSNYDGIIGRSSSSRFPTLSLSGSAGNPCTFQWTGSSAEYNAATGLFLTVGEWNFCAVTITPTLATVYLGSNSLLSNWKRSGTYDAINYNSVRIATDGGFVDYYFNGEIDDVRIYNRALSADEIYRLYTLGR